MRANDDRGGSRLLKRLGYPNSHQMTQFCVEYHRSELQLNLFQLVY